MDQIIIEDLEVSFHVGVPEEERSRPQRLLLTAVMDRDFTRAAAGDALEDTIDYYAVSRRLLKFGANRQWKLIETLAVDIANMILREFKPARVSVTVKKFIIPEARHVAVKVERGNI